MKTLVYTSLLCGSILVAWTAYQSPKAPPPSPAMSALDAERVENDRTVRAWLESQRKGQKGVEHWGKDWWVHPISLYAVSTYEIVDAPYGVTYMVRIHSATRGGQPIVRLYEIFVKEGKIMSVTPQGDKGT